MIGCKQIEELCEDRVFYYFYQISQIPRGSGHEKEISDYVYNWALNRELFVIQDEHYNIFMRKSRKTEKENQNTKSVLLQAHMDMVCEKKPDSVHDFLKDAIVWNIKGDILSSGGETTLGADDGIGMALAMAILEDDTIELPEIEVLFTTSEEEDLSGAESFDMSHVESSFLINLDHVNENEILCGSCGGEAAEEIIPVEWKKNNKEWNVYEIVIEGLKGGHSGEDIGLGRGNANIILARLLYELNKKVEFDLCDICGGNFRLALPREARCSVSVSKDDYEEIRKIITEFSSRIKEEYEGAAEYFKVNIEKSDSIYAKCCDPTDIVFPIMMAPNGIVEMSSDRKGNINASDNLGEIFLCEDGVKMIYEIRALYETSKEYIKNIIKIHAKCFGGKSKYYYSYPSWKYIMNSELRNIAEKVYEKNNKIQPKVYCVHAGLECGYFCNKREKLDVISIGPNCWGLHSPEESVSISSVKRFYMNLREILNDINKT